MEDTNTEDNEPLTIRNILTGEIIARPATDRADGLRFEVLVRDTGATETRSVARFAHPRDMWDYTAKLAEGLGYVVKFGG